MARKGELIVELQREDIFGLIKQKEPDVIKVTLPTKDQHQYERAKGRYLNTRSVPLSTCRMLDIDVYSDGTANINTWDIKQMPRKNARFLNPKVVVHKYDFLNSEKPEGGFTDVNILYGGKAHVRAKLKLSEK